MSESARSPHTNVAYNVYPVPRSQAGLCLFKQQCLLSPTKARLVQSATQGHLQRLFPELSPAFVRRNYVDTQATAKAYLQRTRKNLHTTKTLHSPTSKPAFLPPPVYLTGLPVQLTHTIVTPSYDFNHANYSDTTANFPKTKIHFLVMYAYALNYIKVIPLRGFSSTTYIKAYEQGIEDFETANPSISYKPKLEVMDNVLSNEMRRFLKKKGIQVQLVPPDDHSANNAERSIQTFKKALVAALATAHPDFPLEALPHLAPHIEDIINLLRPSRIDPKISAWEQLHGLYDLVRWPLVPVGAMGIVYEPSTTRALGTFGPHGVVGFYVGRAKEHYGCYTMYIPDTHTTRVTDSVYWLPHNPTYPTYERLPIDIFATEPSTEPNYHLPPPTGPAIAQPERTTSIDAVPPVPVSEGAPAQQEQIPAPDPVQPAVDNSHYPTTPTSGSAPQIHTPSDVPRTPNVPGSYIPHAHPELFDTAPVEAPPENVIQHHLAPRALASDLDSDLPAQPYNLRPRRTLHDSQKHHASAFYAHYERSIRGPKYDIWQESMNREFAMLTETFKDGIKVVDRNEVPINKLKCPFLNPTTREKTDIQTGAITEHRTRLTWGKQARPDDPTLNSSSVASSPVVKLLLNSTVSDPHALLSTIDLDYFYYNTKLANKDYARFHVRLIPPTTRIKLGIAHLPNDAIVYFEVTIAIPGRPDAGKLAQLELIAHLAPYGYHMCPHTPCLFKHNERPTIRFTTHVDDLLIKSDSRTDDYDHLCNALLAKYKIKAHRQATSFLGIHINLQRDPKDHSNDYLRIDIPNGVRKTLKALNFTPTGKPRTPMMYVPPTYSKDDQYEVQDTSPPATSAEQHYLQQAVGYFRWYAPAVDVTLITPISRLASQQANPTQNTMKALQRFLNYAYHHPNASITYRPSDMILWIHSDASHHSESGSRSRTGIFMTCGKPQYTGPHSPYLVNGAVDIISTILTYVTASSAESEYGALFTAGTHAVPHRQTLEDLGHPQPPTPVVYDNQVAGRIANGTAKLKRTKAIAKCYHWFRDRVQKGEFTTIWAPGAHNLGDYFSKIHPDRHYIDIRPVYVTDI